MEINGCQPNNNSSEWVPGSQEDRSDLSHDLLWLQEYQRGHHDEQGFLLVRNSAGGSAGPWAIFINTYPHLMSTKNSKTAPPSRFLLSLVCLPLPIKNDMLAGHHWKKKTPVLLTWRPGPLRTGPPLRDPGSFDLNYLPWAKRSLVSHYSRILIRPGPGIKDANFFFLI